MNERVMYQPDSPRGRRYVLQLQRGEPPQWSDVIFLYPSDWTIELTPLFESLTQEVLERKAR